MSDLAGVHLCVFVLVPVLPTCSVMISISATVCLLASQEQSGSYRCSHSESANDVHR